MNLNPASSLFWQWLPDWGSPVSIRYEFETGIYLGEKTHEQRTPVRDVPQRVMSCVFIETTNKLAIMNMLRYSRITQLWVPLFTEPIKITNTGSLNAKSSLNVSSLANYTNMLGTSAATSVLLFDIAAVNIVQRFDINAVAAPYTNVSFNYGETVAGTQTGESSMLFPALKMFCSSAQEEQLTNTLSSIKVEFREWQ